MGKRKRIEMWNSGSSVIMRHDSRVAETYNELCKLTRRRLENSYGTQCVDTWIECTASDWFTAKLSLWLKRISSQQWIAIYHWPNHKFASYPANDLYITRLFPLSTRTPYWYWVTASPWFDNLWRVWSTLFVLIGFGLEWSNAVWRTNLQDCDILWGDATGETMIWGWVGGYGWKSNGSWHMTCRWSFLSRVWSSSGPVELFFLSS
jgi:hypothetical protein